jgi:hypothetical protein
MSLVFHDLLDEESEIQKSVKWCNKIGSMISIDIEFLLQVNDNDFHEHIF